MHVTSNLYDYVFMCKMKAIYMLIALITVVKRMLQAEV